MQKTIRGKHRNTFSVEIQQPEQFFKQDWEGTDGNLWQTFFGEGHWRLDDSLAHVIYVTDINNPTERESFG